MLDIETAKTLAIAYSNYNKAFDAYDDNGICVWGDILIRAQRDTGVKLYSEQNIENLIFYAKERIDEKDAA